MLHETFYCKNINSRRPSQMIYGSKAYKNPKREQRNSWTPIKLPTMSYLCAARNAFFNSSASRDLLLNEIRSQETQLYTLKQQNLRGKTR